MKRSGVIPLAVLVLLMVQLWGPGSSSLAGQKPVKIIFLHHSTGQCIWDAGVAPWLEKYNQSHGTRYQLSQQPFPKEQPYGWENYPFDYWNIWVKHAGGKPFKQEPTLEMLTQKYAVIVWKHCFPVSSLEEDSGHPDIGSSDKRPENYRLQYEALRNKMSEFPNTKFLIWTGAALGEKETDPASARRAKAFFDWVSTKWDRQGDNIYLWDFRRLETGGGLYLKSAHAAGPQDSHPNEIFSRTVMPLFCRRLIEVAEGRGDTSSLTGE